MSTATKSRLLTFEEARKMVEEYARTLTPSKTELIPLLDSSGLVLAEDLRADRDFPPFARSTRDGFAVRASDVPATATTLDCIGEIKAGADPEHSALVVGEGQCAEIMTGAPVPDGADSVVMVEYTERVGDRVIVQRKALAGENIVPAGAEARKGDVMVARGTCMNHATIAIAAAIGRAEVAAHQRPCVAILATGDEVVDINLPPGPNEIRNSNSYSLAAQVEAAGGDPVVLPVAADREDDLRVLLRKGLEADLLLLTGGVSMGKYDLVEQVLASLGARFFFTGAAIQPGKPVVFGEAPRQDRTVPFFGLPGNPVSTMVTFQLFAQPVLDSLSGTEPKALPFAEARLKQEFTSRTGLTRFLPAKLSGDSRMPQVELIHWQGSGDLMAVSRANCYIVVPPDRERFAAGETISVLLF